ncbi:sortase A [Haloactinopolyspora alba]|uniref:Sortase A n=1 Tax=Haloactinopolyspora alba TaxID=648780 RepID=A0A2P8DY88_9ACTN|nr:class E sortase [Haloactinopolyspora alba]PSL02199.1 sortase A [Haloactinopolyspora alba]
MPRRARRREQEPPRRGLLTAAVGVFGELLLTAGALVLLFVIYMVWGTGIQTAQAQDDLDQQLRQRWDAPAQSRPDEPSELADGEAYGILRIPRFGDGYEKIIVQGVQPDDLEDGPGHYPDTADPGELGNVGIAAHRTGHGSPFSEFPELHVGDRVEIEMADGVYVYELDDAPNGDDDGNKIEISDTWVVDPVPGEPEDAEPTERRITLTTCWPLLGSSHRMYATGTLISGPGS